MNDNNNYFTDEQRRAFAELIKEAQKRFEENFERRIRALNAELAPRIEERSKLRQFVEDIRGLRAKLAQAADSLRKMGFRVIDDGMISVDYEVDRYSHREYQSRLDDAYRDRDEALAGFRQAVFDVWSASDADQVREVVSQLVTDR